MRESETERELREIIREFSKNLPHFPDGRIDYHTSSEAPVITCFVEYQEQILLLRRSDKVGTYRGAWNAVAGYIDEPVPLREKILEELREELGIQEDDLEDLCIAPCYRFRDDGIGKTWIIFPCLARLRSLPKIRLDWEHTDYQWITPGEIKGYLLVPGLEEYFRSATGKENVR